MREVLVGLLELDLLHLEALARLLERLRLLGELFVGDPQLFLLGLQLFRLRLGYLEQLLELPLEERRAHPRADEVA